jgi:hypothetical protein
LNEEGDMIGGIINPILGFSIAIFSFLAFYVQYKANKQVQKQFNIQQFQSQFYEMLRFYKEDVSSIEVIDIFTGNKVKGREAFEYFYKELQFLYECRKYRKLETYSIFNAYNCFYTGDTKDIPKYEELACVTTLGLNFSLSRRYIEDSINISSMNQADVYNIKKRIVGKNSSLGQYYRHLFQMVDIVHKNEELEYSEKLTYSRLLRAQMSDKEQVLLFYNWLAGYKTGKYGSLWEQRNLNFEKIDNLSMDKDKEENKNYFFSDYRMIRNVFRDMIFDDLGENIYDAYRNLKDYKEKDIYPIFEGNVYNDFHFFINSIDKAKSAVHCYLGNDSVGFIELVLDNKDYKLINLTINQGFEHFGIIEKLIEKCIEISEKQQKNLIFTLTENNEKIKTILTSNSFKEYKNGLYERKNWTALI